MIKRILYRKARAKLREFKQELVRTWHTCKQQKKYGYEARILDRLRSSLKRVALSEPLVLINREEEVEHPLRAASLTKECWELSQQREKEKWSAWSGDFKQGDIVAAQLPYWGWGRKQDNLWGRDGELKASGPETYGKVYCASPNYMWISWRPKKYDLVEKDHEGLSKIREQYEKSYSDVHKESRIKENVLKYKNSGWRDKETMRYEYSAIGPEGEKIFFRKVRVPWWVRGWAQRSKLDAGFL